MKTFSPSLRALTTGCAALLLLPGSDLPARPAQAQAPKLAPTLEKGYATYRVIQTRNIFDPDRRPIRTESPIGQSSRSVRESGRSSYIALTGTMVTAERCLAFFTGSQSEYNVVIPTNSKIGSFTIKEITSSHVDLERDGKAYVLVVGKQMTPDGANVAVEVTAPPPSDSATASSSAAPADGAAPSDGAAPAAPAAPGAPSSPGDKSDLIRRMMERRQKEVSK